MEDFRQLVLKRRDEQKPHELDIEPFDPAELRRRLTCPICRGPMDAHPYGGGGNAVVDSCERGNMIWLDAGELAIIQPFGPHQQRFAAMTILETGAQASGGG